MKELEVSKLNTIVEVLEKEIRNQKFLKLQSKKQEERINRLQADVNKYESESYMLRKQMKENTKEYEMQLGITMPKALFFENDLISRKPLVEVDKLQKVISKHISEI